MESASARLLSCAYGFISILSLYSLHLNHHHRNYLDILNQLAQSVHLPITHHSSSPSGCVSLLSRYPSFLIVPLISPYFDTPLLLYHNVLSGSLSFVTLAIKIHCPSAVRTAFPLGNEDNYRDNSKL